MTYPQQPGVYMMKDATGRVLYIGKANNLQSRIQSYTSRVSKVGAAAPQEGVDARRVTAGCVRPHSQGRPTQQMPRPAGMDGPSFETREVYYGTHDQRPQLPYLMAKVATIDTIVVDSERAALLLENTLIKRHQPPYNILLKDDKGYISLKVSAHEWPALQLVRYKGSTPTDGTYYGPYISSTKAHELFDLISRVAPLRQCSDEEFKRRTRPCLLHAMHRCPAPCVQLCTHETYDAQVQRVKRLLTGSDRELIQELKQEMADASEALEYERAGALLRKIKLLEQLRERQQVEAVAVRDADVVALAHRHGQAAIALLSYRGGKLVDAQHVDCRLYDEPSEVVSAFLLQRYLDQPSRPRELILHEPLPDAAALQEVLGLPITVPSKGVKERMAHLAHLNAQAALQQPSSSQLLLQLQEVLQLQHYPQRIECFDTSHHAGASAVAAMVSFVDGRPDKKGYRTFGIKGTATQDDYAMIREVLMRRYRNGALPDLVLIDGGKGHLAVATEVLSELGIATCDVLALSKEAGHHDKALRHEQVHCPSGAVVAMDPKSPQLQLLQRIRDEAHRFVIAFHRRRRTKAVLHSALDDIPGIGPTKKRRLLQTFGSVDAIRAASDEALLAVQGITARDVAALRAAGT